MNQKTLRRLELVGVSMHLPKALEELSAVTKSLTPEVFLAAERDGGTLIIGLFSAALQGAEDPAHEVQ